MFGNLCDRDIKKLTTDEICRELQLSGAIYLETIHYGEDPIYKLTDFRDICAIALKKKIGDARSEGFTQGYDHANSQFRNMSWYERLFAKGLHGVIIL